MVETQANVYERFLSGMMEKDKKQEEKSELPDEDEEENHGEFFRRYFYHRIISAENHLTTYLYHLFAYESVVCSVLGLKRRANVCK